MSGRTSPGGGTAAPGGTAVIDDVGGPVRPASRHLGLALLVIATAQLMVVLDATIVNVALPDIQKALGFSGTGLEWVVNAYALTFGGLLLLGGRAGDILGRRRVFIAGIVLFSVASLLGGFATSEAWLLAARALQGVGGAIVAPTALALVTTTFPEGPPRNRAMGVYAAMSIGGAAVGLLAGGVLTTYLSWRWVLFVNVPIGVVVALLAPRAIAAAPPREVEPVTAGHRRSRRGGFDIPGAITSTLGLAALVYGLSSAATSANGVSHWGDTKVIVSLVAAVVLLARLPHHRVAQQARADAAADLQEPQPVRRLPDHALRRHGDVRDVLLPDHLRADRLGVQRAEDRHRLPADGGHHHGDGRASAPSWSPRIGARPLLLIGSAVGTGGMFWLSRINEHSTYAGGLLGPLIVTAAGLGMLFMPLTLIALSKVQDQDSGLASSLLNTGQQVGGSIGLAVLGTVAWTVVANTARNSAAHAKAAAAAAAQAGHPLHETAAQIAQAKTAIYDHALSVGFSRGFEVSALIALIALIVTIAMIRVTREDLAGVQAMPGA